MHKELLEGVLELSELESKNRKRNKIDITVSLRQGIVNPLPRNYDGYLLHLSQVDTEKDLPNLRREQPWSFIYGIEGQGTTDIVP